MAQSIVALSEVAVLMTIIMLRDNRVFDRYFWSSVGKLISVTGFSVVSAFITVSFYPLNMDDRGIVALGSKLFVISSVTFLTHLIVSYIFGLEQSKVVVAKAKELILKPIRVQ